MIQNKPNATAGRPKQYDKEMLRAVIAEMRASRIAADDIDEKRVKPLLCETHGVSHSINTGSHAEKLRPLAKVERSGAKAAMASAVTGPKHSVAAAPGAFLKKRIPGFVTDAW